MHMVAAIAIAGVVSLLAAELFSSSMKATMDSHWAAEDHVSAQMMLRMLRDDAWSASAITVEDESIVKFAIGRGTVTWTLEEPGVITRTSTVRHPGRPPMTWALPPEWMSFHLEGPTLVLRSHGRSKPHDAAFVSQMMLLQAEGEAE